MTLIRSRYQTQLEPTTQIIKTEKQNEKSSLAPNLRIFEKKYQELVFY